MGLFNIVPLTKTAWKVISSVIGVNRQHDVAVFSKLDAILDESRVEKIFNYSFFTECLRREEREMLYTFVAALRAVENQHRHPVIALRATQLAREMSQLLQTVGSTFSSDDGEVFYFRPDPAAYDRAWDTLHDEIAKTWRAYKTYRQAVKDRLTV